MNDAPANDEPTSGVAAGPVVAVLLGLVLLVVVWILASETIEIDAWPDIVHIAMHIGLFAGITALCVPALGPLRAFGVMLAFGVGVELVQMAGSGRVVRLLDEAAFDLCVDGVGGMVGLALFPVGRAALERAAGPVPLAGWVGIALVWAGLVATWSPRGALISGGFAVVATLVALGSEQRRAALAGVWLVGWLGLAVLWARG